MPLIRNKMSKTEWHIKRGDMVNVKLYEYHGLKICHGIVISEKYEDQNTMFPCVYVYIFGKNQRQQCYSHQLEVLSSAS